MENLRKSLYVCAWRMKYLNKTPQKYTCSSNRWARLPKEKKAPDAKRSFRCNWTDDEMKVGQLTRMVIYKREIKAKNSSHGNAKLTYSTWRSRRNENHGEPNEAAAVNTQGKTQLTNNKEMKNSSKRQLRRGTAFSPTHTAAARPRTASQKGTSKELPRYGRQRWERQTTGAAT